MIKAERNRLVPSDPDTVAIHPTHRPTDRYFLAWLRWNPVTGPHRELPRNGVLGHPKQHWNKRYTWIIANMFELMIAIALNSRLSTSFVLRVTQRCPWHLACILNNVQSCTLLYLKACSDWWLVSHSSVHLPHRSFSQWLDVAHET